MSYCIYLTHPEVAIDPAVPVPDWGLSDIGRSRANKGLLEPWASEIRHVYSSSERKAVETAEVFATRFALTVRLIESMHENDRSATGFLPPHEFEQVADQFFSAPETSIRGWERALDAQSRIVDSVKAVVSDLPTDDPVLLAGHGGVGTLLKCYLLGVPISRHYDQMGGGGCWYRFAKRDLVRQTATSLDWQRL